VATLPASSDTTTIRGVLGSSRGSHDGHLDPHGDDDIRATRECPSATQKRSASGGRRTAARVADRMELDSTGGAAAFSPMQERDGRRARGAGRLQLVQAGRARVGRRCARSWRESERVGVGHGPTDAHRPAAGPLRKHDLIMAGRGGVARWRTMAAVEPGSSERGPSEPDDERSASGSAALAVEGFGDRRRLRCLERLPLDRVGDRVDVDDHAGLELAVLAVEELAAESGEITAVAPEHAA
jgi:hypothetical protein